MQIAHKIELAPTPDQIVYLAKCCGVARFVWNWGLSQWSTQYKAGNKPNGFSLKKELNSIKKEQFPWMYEVTKWASQQPLLNLQSAFNRFFKVKKGYPQFKKKGKCLDSFYLDNFSGKIIDRKFWVPNLGWVKTKESLRFAGKINSYVVSRTADKWFVSVQLDSPVNDPCLSEDSVGVDLGVHKLVTLSNGLSVTPPSPLKYYLRKLKRLQRKLKKKAYRSSNYAKFKMRVARLHARIARIRKDCLHKITTYLTRNFKRISIEDLNVRGMVKNHNLARSISDLGFSEFRRQLEYKAKMRGNELTIVDRWLPSSKTCSSCGSIKDELSLSDRVYECSCGLLLDRDLNAAINLVNYKIPKVLGEFTPVEITAMQKSVYPFFVTSIGESGNNINVC